jgi:uncharacterized protein YndB with AHSA1/START domain
MTDVMDELSLTISRHIAAAPGKVYEAWLRPESLAAFMANCQGMGLARASTDPQVGGKFEIVMAVDGREVPHAGTYLELIPGERLRFTWESAFSIEGSEVTITLAPEGTGTALTLSQRRFSGVSARDGHVKGWDVILTGLAATRL